MRLWSKQMAVDVGIIVAGGKKGDFTCWDWVLEMHDKFTRW